ncbi:tetratricopeptide repeat protein [Candidatus Saccharibacteria bacterium]|nr:tetratricopeptide repeat protein [Candidatus Saccharibacteria bacterium]
MIAVLVILVFVVYLCFFFPMEEKVKPVEEKSAKYTAQMKKLWQIAQTSMRERKPFRAEKALLTILKFDEKNAAAYNRLGILYAKSQRYDQAVECFEIAQSLDNNPASIHNAGLIYLETGAYEKAAMAFRQAISLEGDVPARYIALAKAEEKMGNIKKAIDALENAYELDPKVATLRQILAIYENSGDTEAATATTARIEEQIIRDNEAAKKRAAKSGGKSVRERSARRRLMPTRRAAIKPKPVTKATDNSKSSPSIKASSTSRTGLSMRTGIMKSRMGKKRI